MRVYNAPYNRTIFRLSSGKKSNQVDILSTNYKFDYL